MWLNINRRHENLHQIETDGVETERCGKGDWSLKIVWRHDPSWAACLPSTARIRRLRCFRVQSGLKLNTSHCPIWQRVKSSGIRALSGVGVNGLDNAFVLGAPRSRYAILSFLPRLKCFVLHGFCFVLFLQCRIDVREIINGNANCVCIQ